MITEHDLQEAIAECEGQKNPNANTCLKLAAFYTIKDKLYPERSQNQNDEKFITREKYSYASNNPSTEFKKIIANIEPYELIPIMEELMETLSVVSPRIYDSVIRRIKDI